VQPFRSIGRAERVAGSIIPAAFRFDSGGFHSRGRADFMAWEDLRHASSRSDEV
jgi:hypothetical protein